MLCSPSVFVVTYQNGRRKEQHAVVLSSSPSGSGQLDRPGVEMKHDGGGKNEVENDHHARHTPVFTPHFPSLLHCTTQSSKQQFSSFFPHTIGFELT